MNQALRFGISLTLALYVVFAVPAGLLAGLLLVHGETCQGRLFASAVMVGLATPVVGCFAAYRQRRRRPLALAAGLALSALLLLGVNYALTPDGQAQPGAAIRSCFAGPAVYRRASPANLVPEMDQLVLGTYVMSALDPRLDQANTRELRAQVREVYGEMRQAPEFECLGSVMNQAYREIFLGDRPAGHFYEYLPPSAAKERLPVVLFLHGSLGNFKGYLWVWKRLADERGFAIVAPTFGAGNWHAPGGVAAIEQARRYCSTHPRLDPTRIFLAGLSNGGRGVCLGARQSPAGYRGLIFISPVLYSGELLSDSFSAAWKDKPVLIVHGTADNRVPVAYVEQAVAALAKTPMRLDYQPYAGQTHFLFFTQRQQLMERLGNWLATAGTSPAAPGEGN